MTQKVERKPRRWLKHWYSKPRGEHLALFGLLLTAWWLTEHWLDNRGAPLALAKMTVAWYSTLYMWVRALKEPKKPLRLNLDGPPSEQTHGSQS